MIQSENRYSFDRVVLSLLFYYYGKKKTNTKALLCEMKENVRKVDSSITFCSLYDSRENVVTLLLFFLLYLQCILCLTL